MPGKPHGASVAVPGMVRRAAVYMDTTVAIEVGLDRDEASCLAAIELAFGWFDAVERECSRFDPASGFRALCASPGTAVAVSPMLYSALAVAVNLAEETNGAFDPTVGGALERAGFTRDFRTGEHSVGGAAGGSYRDVLLDPAAQTVTLARRLTLDLGAVAKGLAIDLAARALEGFYRFAVFVGGDLKVARENIDESGRRGNHIHTVYRDGSYGRNL